MPPPFVSKFESYQWLLSLLRLLFCWPWRLPTSYCNILLLSGLCTLCLWTPNIELGVSTVIGLPAVALVSPAPILVLLSLPQDNCNLTYRSLSLSWQELMHSKETLVSLGYQTMKQWSLSNWNFPRNLVLGKGRGLKLVPVGGGTCLLEKDPTQLVRPLCRRQSGDHAG